MPESALLGPKIAPYFRGAYITIKQRYLMHWETEDPGSEDFPIGKNDGGSVA